MSKGCIHARFQSIGINEELKSQVQKIVLFNLNVSIFIVSSYTCQISRAPRSIALAAASFPYLVRDLKEFVKSSIIKKIFYTYKNNINWKSIPINYFYTYHFGTSLMVNNECGDAGKKHRSSAIFGN